MLQLFKGAHHERRSVNELSTEALFDFVFAEIDQQATLNGHDDVAGPETLLGLSKAIVHQIAFTERVTTVTS